MGKTNDDSGKTRYVREVSDKVPSRTGYRTDRGTLYRLYSGWVRTLYIVGCRVVRSVGVATRLTLSRIMLNYADH